MRRPPAPAGPLPSIPELERAMVQGLQAKVGSAAACMLTGPRGRERGQVLHHAQLGTARTGPPLLRLLPRARFDVGALTATVVTATLAAVLVGRHRLELGRTLGAVCANEPGLRDGPWRDVPLETLLDHTSGLPDAGPAFAAALAPIRALGAAPVRGAAEQMRSPAASTLRRDVRASRTLGGPLDAEATARLRRTLQRAAPTHRPGEAQRPSALNALALGWAIEALLQQPLDLAFQTWVAEPLELAEHAAFVRCGPGGPWRPPSGGVGQSDVVAGPHCPYRHRALHGEPSCPIAYYLGGVAGHEGLFADVQAVHAVLQAHLAALEGRPSPLSAGVVQRFWSRSKRVADSPWALGWQVASRDNGMAPGRWNARSVGATAAGGAAFVDPSFGVVGTLLCNVGQAPDAAAAAGWDKVRLRVFDAMASFGQYAPAAARADGRQPPR